MASFNVKPEAQPAPNYTGASQGIHASPNTALGTLFEGLASALDSGIKEADRATQEQIRNEIFDNVDSIQDEFGVSSATLFQEDEGSAAATPPMLNDAGRHLNGLQAQYERGAIKESHYWARMNSMVRQLRGRYPGYRAEIDSMVSSIVGARPANALRNALFNEWEDAANAKDQATKDYNDLVEWALKAPPSVAGRTYLPSDFLQRQQEGNPYSMTELQAHILDVQTQEGTIQSTRARMALEVEQDNFNKSRAEKAFSTEATTFVNGLLSDTANGLGKTYTDIQRQLTEAQQAAARGDPMDAEALQTLPAQIAQLQAGIQQALNQKFTESWDGDPSHSYAAHLDNETRQSIIQTAMAPVAILSDAILNEDYGVVNSVTAYLKAGQTQDQRELLGRIPLLGSLQALKDVAGPEAFGLYLSVVPEVQQELSKVLLDYHHSRSALGDGSITQAFSDGENAGARKEYYDGLIKTWQNTVNEAVSGKFPPEVIAGKVSFMFGAEALQVLGMMTPESRYEYYKKVASPQVTQQMIALKKAGDVDSWNTYQNWVASSFISLFQSAVKDLPSALPNTQGVSVVWDPTTYGFKVVGDVSRNIASQAMPFGLPNPMAGAETQMGVNALNQKLGNLNAAIRVMAPILEENGGDVSEELIGLLTQMGYNPEKGKEPNMLQSIDAMLGDALIRGLMSIGVMDEPGPTSKFATGEV